MDKQLNASGRQDHCTPEGFLVLVRTVLGRIDLDPCASRDSVVGATESYYTEDDGLKLPWFQAQGNGLEPGAGVKVFCNPPYARDVVRWIDKCIEEHAGAAGGDELILLTASRTDTRWFQRLFCHATTVCFWRGRLTFRGCDAPAPFPSLVSYFGDRPTWFRSVFGKAGICP